MRQFQTNFLSLTLFLATTALSFGSIISSCSVELDGVTTTQPPCSLSTEDGAATASAGGIAFVSAGVTGVAEADVGGDYSNYLWPGSGSLLSSAAVDAQFSSAGPIRLGTLTITSNSFAYVSTNGRGSLLFKSTGYTITQGNFTYSEDCFINDIAFCSSETIPINLGLPFTVSGESEVGTVFSGSGINWPPYNNYWDAEIYDQITFTLQDQDGVTVDSILLPDTSSVPEPATQATVGLAFVFAFLAVRFAAMRRSHAGQHRLR